MSEMQTIREAITESLQRAEQEWDIALPKRLFVAFRLKAHEKHTDPATGEPFCSFGEWLLSSPPFGCGLAGRRYLRMEDIRQHLAETMRGESHPNNRKVFLALINDLTHSQAPARPAGRPRKGEEGNSGSAPAIRHRNSGGTASLAARMSESTDPKVRKAWESYLMGKILTVHATAVACGLIKDGHNPLTRLKQYWKKATTDQRKEFLEFVKAHS